MRRPMRCCGQGGTSTSQEREHAEQGDGGWGSPQRRVIDEVVEFGSRGGAHHWWAPVMDDGAWEGVLQHRGGGGDVRGG
jgi:hypothetical protein